jgi:hypothetical protein
MDDEELLRNNNPSNSASPPQPSTYDRLMRQSKKLGHVATTTTRAIRNILTQEIPLPSSELFKSVAPQDAPVTQEKQQELNNIKQLKQAVEKSNQVLASARTVFPVTLFPDSIIVDRTKVSIIKRDFFFTSNVISFQIEDILNVSCAVGPLFGSLTIASRVMSTIDHFNINYLWRNDALFIKNLIQGHIIAKNNKLETEHLSIKETIDALWELGKDSGRR